jgi:hypothetical protein
MSRMGLPTQMGYYESTRGSMILRAKTPMYLLRPVNSSDSVLALSRGKGGRGGKINTVMDDSVGDDNSLLSSSSTQSISTLNSSVKRKKNRKSDARIQVI